MNFKKFSEKYLFADRTLLGLTGLLFLMSLVTVFSSTALTDEVLSGKVGRWDLFLEQVRMISIFAGGICFFLIVLNVSERHGINLIRIAPIWFYGIAVVLSLMLGLGISTDPRLPDRALRIAGAQINVPEFLKFFLTFALIYFGENYKNGDTPLAETIINKFHIENEDWQQFARRVVCLYAPALLCILCIFSGSFSSSLFLGVISLIVFALYVEKKAFLRITGAGGVLLILGLVAVFSLSYSQLISFGRGATVKARIEYFFNDKTDINVFEKGSASYNEMVDYIRQIEGSKKAIKEGGLTGVGPGQSKQKYKVAAFHNDFLFSFICEEYGLVGGFVVILIFLLIALRCRYLSRFLEDPFEEHLLMVFGFLITLQAFMHIAVNLGVVPMTGQALPLLSSGNSALMTFSMIICVILYLSGKALRTKAEKEGALTDTINIENLDTKIENDDESDN